MLLFFQLRLGSRSHTDGRHTAGQMAQSLLQRLAVILRLILHVGVLDLPSQLGHAGLDILLRAVATDDGCAILIGDDPIGAPQVLQGDSIQSFAHLLAYHRSSGKCSEILHHL